MSKRVGEFERETAEDHYEWSVPTASDLGRSYRLFVSIDADVSPLICVEECPVTSARPTARRLEVEPTQRRSVTLTRDDARWLLATLPKAIARIEAEWTEGPPKPPLPAGFTEPVHVSLWSAQPDILIACDHSWTTPAWGQRTADESALFARGVYKADDGRFYTFDEAETTCSTCRSVLGDPVLRQKAGTP